MGDPVGTDQWYYERDGDAAGPFTIDELEQLARDRRIGPETKIWAEGTDHAVPASQTPLAGVFAEPVQTKPVSTPVPGLAQPSRYRYVDLGFRTRMLQVLLVGFTVMSAVALWSDRLEMRLIGDIIEGVDVTQEQVAENLQRQAEVDSWWDWSWLVTAVIFLPWIYRACANAHAMGARGMKYRPGWAVGYFFVPILHLWKPYNAMEETYKASSDPQSPHWAEFSSPLVINLWWAAWIFAHAFDLVVHPVFFDDSELVGDPTAVLTWAGLRLFVDVAFILLGVAAFVMVGAMYAVQRNSYHALNAGDDGRSGMERPGQILSGSGLRPGD